MTTAVHLLMAMGLVLGNNLLPAFGPPTWTVLVFARFRWPDIPPAALIIGGALAATAGRLALAVGVRKLGGRLSPERRANLSALGNTLAGSKSGILAGFALFVFSPLPSAQLFMAAGLANVPLFPLCSAFFIGRTVSYTLYVTAATAAEETIRLFFDYGEISPSTIVVQLAGLGAIILMIKLDWIRIIDWTRARLARLRGRPAPPSVRPPSEGP